LIIPSNSEADLEADLIITLFLFVREINSNAKDGSQFNVDYYLILYLHDMGW
jgi:hypothetical protein